MSFLSMGFRPLYLAGTFWAAASVMIWIYAPNLASGLLGGLVWHAHEMLWGFIAAIAVGFLLTASATWTGINPLKGSLLAATCLLWAVARIGFLMPHPSGFLIGAASELAFLLTAALALARVVVRARSRRNYVLPLLLLGLGVIDAFFLWAVWQGDLATALQRFELGLICMAVIAVLVARRVIPFFAMRAVAGLKIPMHESSAKIQLVAGVAAILFALADLRLPLAAALGSIAAISAAQLWSWRPWAIRGKPLLWILYLGYAGVGAGLATACFHALGLVQRPAIHTHVIAIGGLSVLVIGMVTRTALGHLSRPLKLDFSMLSSYCFVLAAFAFRMMAIIPSPWSWVCIQLSAAAWAVAFSLYVVRFAPMMAQSNVTITVRSVK